MSGGSFRVIFEDDLLLSPPKDVRVEKEHTHTKKECRQYVEEETARYAIYHERHRASWAIRRENIQRYYRYYPVNSFQKKTVN